MGDNDYDENDGQNDDGMARDLPELDSDDALFDSIEDAAAEMEEEMSNRVDPEILAGAAVSGLQDEIERLNDRLMRSAAELENTRRRAEKERVDAGKYAIANFARDLLSVADNFERALAAAPEDPTQMSEDALKGLFTGVSMTEKELLTTLERHGVKRIAPKGEKFDPNVHQAVAQSPAHGVPAGHVAEVAQTGFILGDRVLRAAMVIVSTGAPADTPEATDTTNQQTDGSTGEAGSAGKEPPAAGSRVNTRV
ncbi:MAG: nucleotide exchange factor GrpE [Pseudomonadota bacterium]